MQQTRRFDARAALGYDEGVLRRVPGYALALELANAVLASQLPSDASLIVVGAGTGAEILYLASRNPDWRFSAVDISTDMLAIARHRIEEAGFAGRVAFFPVAMQAAAGLPRHDAGLAQLVSQFIAHDEKPGFYASIAQSLASRAPLLSLDYQPDRMPGMAVLRQWAMAAGADRADVDTMVTRITRSWYAPTEAQLNALWRAAGFLPESRYMQALAYTGTILRRQ